MKPLIVRRNGKHISRQEAYLVKAAIGEDVDNETLGGAETHCEISGVTDYKCKDDTECLTKIKSIVDKIGAKPKVLFDRAKSVKPALNGKEIYGIFSAKTIQKR